MRSEQDASFDNLDGQHGATREHGHGADRRAEPSGSRQSRNERAAFGQPSRVYEDDADPGQHERHADSERHYKDEAPRRAARGDCGEQ